MNPARILQLLAIFLVLFSLSANVSADSLDNKIVWTSDNFGEISAVRFFDDSSDGKLVAVAHSDEMQGGVKDIAVFKDGTLFVATHNDGGINNCKIYKATEADCEFDPCKVDLGEAVHEIQDCLDVRIESAASAGATALKDDLGILFVESVVLGANKINLHIEKQGEFLRELPLDYEFTLDDTDLGEKRIALSSRSGNFYAASSRNYGIPANKWDLKLWEVSQDRLSGVYSKGLLLREEKQYSSCHLKTIFADYEERIWVGSSTDNISTPSCVGAIWKYDLSENSFEDLSTTAGLYNNNHYFSVFGFDQLEKDSSVVVSVIHATGPNPNEVFLKTYTWIQFGTQWYNYFADSSNTMFSRTKPLAMKYTGTVSVYTDIVYGTVNSTQYMLRTASKYGGSNREYVMGGLDVFVTDIEKESCTDGDEDGLCGNQFDAGLTTQIIGLDCDDTDPTKKYWCGEKFGENALVWNFGVWTSGTPRLDIARVRESEEIRFRYYPEDSAVTSYGFDFTMNYQVTGSSPADMVRDADGNVFLAMTVNARLRSSPFTAYSFCKVFRSVEVEAGIPYFTEIYSNRGCSDINIGVNSRNVMDQTVNDLIIAEIENGNLSITVKNNYDTYLAEENEQVIDGGTATNIGGVDVDADGKVYVLKNVAGGGCPLSKNIFFVLEKSGNEYTSTRHDTAGGSNCCTATEASAMKVIDNDIWIGTSGSGLQIEPVKKVSKNFSGPCTNVFSGLYGYNIKGFEGRDGKVYATGVLHSADPTPPKGKIFKLSEEEEWESLGWVERFEDVLGEPGYGSGDVQYITNPGAFDNDNRIFVNFEFGNGMFAPLYLDKKGIRVASDYLPYFFITTNANNKDGDGYYADSITAQILNLPIDCDDSDPYLGTAEDCDFLPPDEERILWRFGLIGSGATARIKAGRIEYDATGYPDYENLTSLFFSFDWSTDIWSPMFVDAATGYDGNVYLALEFKKGSIAGPEACRVYRVSDVDHSTGTLVLEKVFGAGGLSNDKCKDIRIAVNSREISTNLYRDDLIIAYTKDAGAVDPDKVYIQAITDLLSEDETSTQIMDGENQGGVRDVDIYEGKVYVAANNVDTGACGLSAQNIKMYVLEHSPSGYALTNTLGNGKCCSTRETNAIGIYDGKVYVGLITDSGFVLNPVWSAPLDFSEDCSNTSSDIWGYNIIEFEPISNGLYVTGIHGNEAEPYPRQKIFSLNRSGGWSNLGWTGEESSFNNITNPTHFDGDSSALIENGMDTGGWSKIIDNGRTAEVDSSVKINVLLASKPRDKDGDGWLSDSSSARVADYPYIDCDDSDDTLTDNCDGVLQCEIGEAIPPSGCLCDGQEYNTGYCCATGWQAEPCQCSAHTECDLGSCCTLDAGKVCTIFDACIPNSPDPLGSGEYCYFSSETGMQNNCCGPGQYFCETGCSNTPCDSEITVTITRPNEGQRFDPQEEVAFIADAYNAIGNPIDCEEPNWNCAWTYAMAGIPGETVFGDDRLIAMKRFFDEADYEIKITVSNSETGEIGSDTVNITVAQFFYAQKVISIVASDTALGGTSDVVVTLQGRNAGELVPIAVGLKCTRSMDQAACDAEQGSGQFSANDSYCPIADPNTCQFTVGAGGDFGYDFDVDGRYRIEGKVLGTNDSASDTFTVGQYGPQQISVPDLPIELALVVLAVVFAMVFLRKRE